MKKTMIVGLLFIFVGLLFLITGTAQCITTLSEKDDRIYTTATITRIEEYKTNDSETPVGHHE